LEDAAVAAPIKVAPVQKTTTKYDAKWLTEIRGEHDCRESFSGFFNDETSAMSVVAVARCSIAG
jgi:hypothetical protein